MSDLLSARTASQQRIISLGSAIELMLRTGRYSRFPVGNLSAWLVPAVDHGYIEVFRGVEDDLRGFVTWAYFDKSTVRQMNREPRYVPSASEWSGGDHLWMIDMVALTPAVFSRIRQFIRDELSAGVSDVNWTSRRGQARCVSPESGMKQ